MAREPRVTHQRTIIRLERSAHVLTRVHEELRASPSSARITRLLEANQNARAEIAQRLQGIREKQQTKRAMPVE